MMIVGSRNRKKLFHLAAKPNTIKFNYFWIKPASKEKCLTVRNYIAKLFCANKNFSGFDWKIVFQWLKNIFWLSLATFTKNCFEVFHSGKNLKNIASHFSRVLRLKQKQNHLSLCTMKKFDGFERGKVFPCFRQEKHHKFAAFFNVEQILQEWHFQCSIDKSATYRENSTQALIWTCANKKIRLK